MHHNMFPLLSLVALSLLAIPSDVRADDFGFGNFGATPAVASLNRDTQSTASVKKLPSNFGNTSVEKVEVFASDEELAASHASNNVLLLAGLAGLLGVGMAITGICILRRKPRRTATRILVNA